MDEKLIEAANMLKEHCKGRPCEFCLFGREGDCALKQLPTHWKVQKQPRWTAEDVALAKALKAFGATTIYRYSPDLSAWKADRNVGALPYGAFTDLKAEERLSIDDIIAGGEE